MLHETFRRKEKCFVEHLGYTFLCVAVFKLLVFKISTVKKIFTPWLVWLVWLSAGL